MTEAGSIGNMTDAEMQTMLRRALRLVLILGAALALVFTFARGWQSGLLAVAGTAVSYTGILEWRSLALAVFARLDSQQQPRPMGRTLAMFFVRLAAVGAILYVSLKFLNGTVYALIAGIGLAVVALSIEALRLVRG